MGFMTPWRWVRAVVGLLVLVAGAFQIGRLMAPQWFFVHPDLWREPPVAGVSAEICDDVVVAVSEYLEWEPGDLDPMTSEFYECRASGDYLGRSVSITIEHSPGGSSVGGFPETCVEEAYETVPLLWDIVSGIVVCTPDLRDETFSSTFFVSRNMPLMVAVLDGQDVVDEVELNRIAVTTLIESMREAE